MGTGTGGVDFVHAAELGAGRHDLRKLYAFAAF